MIWTAGANQERVRPWFGKHLNHLGERVPGFAGVPGCWPPLPKFLKSVNSMKLILLHFWRCTFWSNFTVFEKMVLKGLKLAFLSCASLWGSWDKTIRSVYMGWNKGKRHCGGYPSSCATALELWHCPCPTLFKPHFWQEWLQVCHPSLPLFLGAREGQWWVLSRAGGHAPFLQRFLFLYC